MKGPDASILFSYFDLEQKRINQLVSDNIDEIDFNRIVENLNNIKDIVE